MRLGLCLELAFALASIVPLARCGTGTPIPLPPGDGSADVAPKGCVTSFECPKGYDCFFAVSEGCGARGRCLQAQAASCSNSWCPCGDVSVSCGPPGYATAPVFYPESGVCPAKCVGWGAVICECNDVSGYAPSVMSAPVVTANACTAAQLTDVTAACFDPNASPQSCDAWKKANAVDAGDGCFGCLFTPQSSATWGAIVCDATSCSLNGPGCVDLVLNQRSQERAANGTGSCGDRLHEAYGCLDYACNRCSKTGTLGSTDYDECEKSAAMNECASYFAGTESSNGPCTELNGDASPPAATSCLSSAVADVRALLDIFCGTGP